MAINYSLNVRLAAQRVRVCAPLARQLKQSPLFEETMMSIASGAINGARLDEIGFFVKLEHLG